MMVSLRDRRPTATGARRDHRAGEAAKESDYPALFRAADAASLAGQARYLLVVRADLLLVVIAALISAGVTLVSIGLRSPFAAAAAIILAGSVTVKLINRLLRHDGDWFNARAVAESVKTESWRYMMRLGPFADDATCDAEFALDLRAILGARPTLWPELGTYLEAAQQVPPKMRAVRALSLEQRRDTYLQWRLDEQAAWYRTRAASSHRAAQRWFWVPLGAQVVALTVAIARVMYAFGGFNVLAAAAAVSAALTAFVEAGRYEELAKSYALAEQELLLIRGTIASASCQPELDDAVRDAEGAISRRHIIEGFDLHRFPGPRLMPPRRPPIA